MQPLTELPNIVLHERYSFPAHNHQATECALLVSPSQAWAVASEAPATQGLFMQSLPALAAKICADYLIPPALLVLLVRYAFDEQTYYLVRFSYGDADLFEGIRFLDPIRQEQAPEALSSLFAQLASGQAPDAGLRALARP